jgi:transketolase
MRIRPEEPDWENRDRFLLGKGHAAVGHYPILADLGYYDPSLLDTYTRVGSPFGDHPDMKLIPGADFSSGSLGHNLSVSVGMALAGKMDALDYRVFCLLGDGEMNEGQNYEAMMAAGNFKLSNLVAIVDRNQMSLDGFTEEVMPIEPLADKWRAFKWEVWEIDGHDLNALVDAFDALDARTDDRPLCIIAQTHKGHGLSFMDLSREWHLGLLVGEDYDRAMAELVDGGSQPTFYEHADWVKQHRDERNAIFRAAPVSGETKAPARVSAPPTVLRDPKSWSLITSAQQTTEAVSGRVLAGLAGQHPEIVGMTADLKYSNRLSDFAEEWPDRFVNMGIAEQNMVSASAGMAACGKMPFIGTFAAFVALLGCEHIRTDIAYNDLPVRILAHHSGITMGYYGTNHHALEDIAITRAITNLTVFCPADAPSIKAGIEASLDWPGPIYFRLGRGREPVVYHDGVPDFEFGKAITFRDGKDLTVITNGLTMAAAVEAVETLAGEGIDCRLIDLHTVKPLDRDVIIRAARETGGIFTVEEHNVIGGIGSAVAEVLADNGIAIPFHRHGIYDEFALIGPPAALYAHYHLDGPGIAQEVREWWKKVS